MFRFITSRKKNAERARILGLRLPGLSTFVRVVAEIGQAQSFLEASAIGVRIGAHSPRCRMAPVRGTLEPACHCHRRTDSGFNASASSFQEREVVRDLSLTAGQRYLMRAPEALEKMAFHFARSGPALWRAQHDHGPARPADDAVVRGRLADARGFPERNAPRSPPWPDACCRYRSLPRNKASSRSRGRGFPVLQCEMRASNVGLSIL